MKISHLYCSIILVSAVSDKWDCAKIDETQWNTIKDLKCMESEKAGQGEYINIHAFNLASVRKESYESITSRQGVTLEFREDSTKVYVTSFNLDKQESRQIIADGFGVPGSLIPDSILRPGQNLTEKFNVTASSGAIFYYIRFKCKAWINLVGNAAVIRSYGEPKPVIGIREVEVTIETRPFQIDLPDLGSCLAKDQYLPVTRDSEKWFNRNDSSNMRIELELPNSQYIWLSWAADDRFGNAKPYISYQLAIDLSLMKIRDDVETKFRAIGQSISTGENWGKGVVFDRGISTIKGSRISGGPWKWNITLLPQTFTRVYQLVATCGQVTAYSRYTFRRVHDLQQNCIGFPNAKSGSIEDCGHCQDLSCADETDFRDKAKHPEYLINENS